MSNTGALQLAKEQNLNLVVVAKNTTPPIAKILDWGKYNYEKDKKKRNNRSKQSKVSELRR